MSSVTVVVLFNLKAGADVREYEQWARTTDLPIVNKLPSVDSFEVLRTTGLLGSDAPAPYRYVEILRINDLDQLGKDVATDTMQRVVKEFGQFADQPQFMLTQSL